MECGINGEVLVGTKKIFDKWRLVPVIESNYR